MKWLVLLICVTLLTLGGLAYVRVSWWRMESACTADPPGAPSRDVIDMGWSWDPVGFQCRFDDGSERTELWVGAAP